MAFFSTRKIKTAAILLSASALGTIWIAKTAQAPQTIDTSVVSAITEIPSSLVDTSFATRSVYPVASGTQVLLIPHHLVAGREIASLLRSAATPTRVLLLSPDHFSASKRSFSFPEQQFSWQSKPIPTDPSLQKTLTKALRASTETSSRLFEREHGVRGLLPFLTTAWPEAKIVPITVRNDTPKKALAHLVDTIETHFLKKGDLLVFTIDFSHDLPEYVANLHDLLSEDALRALDIDATTNVEIDSRPLFFTLISLAQRLKTPALPGARIHAHTNALRLMKAKTTSLGTSHFVASLAPNEPNSRSLFTTLVHDEHRPVSSKEGRFYQGFDTVTTATTPFSAAFVRVTRTTSTEWNVLPLKRVGTGWLPLSDQEQNALSQDTITRWIEWAKMHLTPDLRP